MCIEVVWYGERGIINALITELARREPPRCAGRALVQAIRWADGGNPNWTNAIQSVACIVEVDLHKAGFGSPDLILVAAMERGGPHVMFVEGKVGGFAECALPNNPGMAISGFNSSINGQLALRYRFAKALEGWDGEEQIIAEPNELRLAYSRPPADGGLGDVCRYRRHLRKRSVLAILREYAVFGLPEDHYHFVALTGDTEPFWLDQTVREANSLPLFLQPLPDGSDRWAELEPRLGWLGYQAITDHLQPGLPFQKALRTMAAERATVPAQDTGVQGPCNRLLHQRLREFAIDSGQVKLFERSVCGRSLTATIWRLGGQRQLIARISNRTYAEENNRPTEELFELAPAFSQSLGPIVQNGRVAIPIPENHQFVDQVIHALEQVL